MFGLEKVTCNLIMVGLLITAGEVVSEKIVAPAHLCFVLKSTSTCFVMY